MLKKEEKGLKKSFVKKSADAVIPVSAYKTSGYRLNLRLFLLLDSPVLYSRIGVSFIRGCLIFMSSHILLLDRGKIRKKRREIINKILS